MLPLLFHHILPLLHCCPNIKGSQQNRQLCNAIVQISLSLKADSTVEYATITSFFEEICRAINECQRCDYKCLQRLQGRSYGFLVVTIYARQKLHLTNRFKLV